MPKAGPNKLRKGFTVLDETDLKILTMMRSNARVSLTAMAKKLGLSKTTVKYRVDSLVRTGVIRSFFALVDSSVYGKSLSVVFDLTVEPQLIESVATKLSSYSEVMRVYELASSPQLHVHGLFSNPDSLEQFIRHKLYSIPGIRDMKTGTIMKRYKVDLTLTI